MRAVADVVLRVSIHGAARTGEVGHRGDAILQIRMRRVDAGIDDRDADAVAVEPRLPYRWHVKEGDALVEHQLHRERRSRDDAARGERRDQRRLLLGRDVEDDDMRPLVGLADRRAVATEQVGGDAGRDGLGLGVRGVFVRQHRRADRARWFDHEARAERFGSRRGFRLQHVAKTVPAPSSPTRAGWSRWHNYQGQSDMSTSSRS